MSTPTFNLWAMDANRRYEQARAGWRQTHPIIPAKEIARLEVEVALRKERWVEKLRGMRD